MAGQFGSRFEERRGVATDRWVDQQRALLPGKTSRLAERPAAATSSLNLVLASCRLTCTARTVAKAAKGYRPPVRVTSKGQVTIPTELRERFGLRPGEEVEVVAGHDGVVVRLAAGAAGRGARLVARMRGRADEELSADAILRLTRSDD